MSNSIEVVSNGSQPKSKEDLYVKFQRLGLMSTYIPVLYVCKSADKSQVLKCKSIEILCRSSIHPCTEV